MARIGIAMKKIDPESPLPKYYQIRDSIKSMISSGKWKEGHKLDTCRDLAKYFETTSLTINQTMGLLEKENLIQRIQGKGIYVTVPNEDDSTSAIYSFMTLTGDFYGGMFSSLISCLNQDRYNVIPIDSSSFREQMLWEQEEKLKRITSEGSVDLVIDACNDFPFKLLSKYSENIRQLLFINKFETKLSFKDANFVLADYFQSGYMAANHLLKKGIKDIAFFSNGYPDGSASPIVGPEKSYARDIYDGIVSAMKKYCPGKPKKIYTFFDTSPDTEEKFYELIVKKKIKYIICCWDFLALTLYDLASKYKLQVGKDLYIISFLNTPWADKMNPKLTSISMNEHKVGETAAKAIAENWKGEKVKIKPELFIRESA